MIISGKKAAQEKTETVSPQTLDEMKMLKIAAARHLEVVQAELAGVKISKLV